VRDGRWNRDFSLFFVARAAARLGDMMLPVALAAGLIQYGFGVGAVGVAIAANSAAARAPGPRPRPRRTGPGAKSCRGCAQLGRAGSELMRA